MWRKATVRNVRAAALLVFAVLFASNADAATMVSLDDGQGHAAANSGALQSAINRATSGDTLNISAGRFYISDSIVLRSGINIAGTGTMSTTIVPSFHRAQPMIFGRGVKNVEMSGLAIDGQGSDQITQGIELEKCTALHFHDLAITNLPGVNQPNALPGPHAIDCTAGVTHSIFDSITCRSIGIGKTWGAGIRLSWNSTDNQITRCTVKDTGRGGIFCNDGSTDNIIEGNTVSGSGGAGLGIEVQNCDRSLIENNKLDHWLSVDNASSSAVRGNTIGTTDHSIKLCGIEIVDSHDVIVSGNNVDGGSKVGLSISGPKAKDRLVFLDNSFAGSTTWGAQIQGDAGSTADLYFENNRFIDTRLGPESLYPNQGHGLRINGDAHSITFDQNQMTGNAGTGLQITGEHIDNLYFYNNVIKDNRSGSIDSDPIAHLWWLGNHVSPPSKWSDNAQQSAPPAITLHLDGAKETSPGHWLIESRDAIHLAIVPNPTFSPTNALWDFGHGLPIDDLIAEKPFDTAGSYDLNVIAWDATGRAARCAATIDIKIAAQR